MQYVGSEGNVTSDEEFNAFFSPEADERLMKLQDDTIRRKLTSELNMAKMGFHSDRKLVDEMKDKNVSEEVEKRMEAHYIKDGNGNHQEE